MEFLEDESRIAGLRTELMEYLNSVRINGRAILALVRMVKAVAFPVGEKIIRQNEQDLHIYVLVRGKTRVSAFDGGSETFLGERSAKTLLGEIAFFNGTVPTATVEVIGEEPAVAFRLTHDQFRELLENYPDVRETLAHIGDMRVIRQFEGFINYRLFMEMIGSPKDRFAINRAMASEVDFAITHSLLAGLPPDARILDVGDGPGVVAEMIAETAPDLLFSIYLQATHLEEAITKPAEPLPSDFSRAKNLREKFEAIVALQVFNLAAAEDLPEQFEIANRLLADDGRMLVLRSNLLDIHHPAGAGESVLIFHALEELVQQVWPEVIGDRSLVVTSFLDADLEPMMEWDRKFCDQAAAGNLVVPEGVEEAETALLGFLLDQARRHAFNPDQLHFQWLVWKAAQHGFQLVKSGQNLDQGFYFQLYSKK